MGTVDDALSILTRLIETVRDRKMLTELRDVMSLVLAASSEVATLRSEKLELQEQLLDRKQELMDAKEKHHAATVKLEKENAELRERLKRAKDDSDDPGFFDSGTIISG